MRESQFQSELKESFYKQYPQGMYIKLPDMPRSSTSRFIPTKPFDFLLILQDMILAIETKLLKNGHTSINMKSDSGKNMLRQILDLQHVESLGGKSYLSVEVVGKFRGMDKKIKKAFFFTPEEMGEMVHKHGFSVQGIMEFSKTKGIISERIKGYWDLSKIL